MHGARARKRASRFNTLAMRLILLLILLLLVIGALPTWPYSTGWGYYPSGLGLVLDCLAGNSASLAAGETDQSCGEQTQRSIFFNSHLVAQWPECVSQFLQA